MGIYSGQGSNLLVLNSIQILFSIIHNYLSDHIYMYLKFKGLCPTDESDNSYYDKLSRVLFLLHNSYDFFQIFAYIMVTSVAIDISFENLLLQTQHMKWINIGCCTLKSCCKCVYYKLIIRRPYFKKNQHLLIYIIGKRDSCTTHRQVFKFKQEDAQCIAV